MNPIKYSPNRIIDSDGISDGGAVYVYQTGSSTLVNLFVDSDLTTPTTNPYVVATGAAVPVLYTNHVGDLRLRVISYSGEELTDEDPYYSAASTQDLASTDSDKGASLVGFKQVGSGSVNRTVQQKIEESVSVKDFGAVCDGTTDDTDAVQAAIDACLASTPARALIVPGPCLLTSSVNIDRGVDTESAFFDIFGQGQEAGFVVDDAITMFSTTLPSVDDGTSFTPSTEYVRFNNVFFGTTDAAYALGDYGTVLDGRYLRTTFNHCDFYKVKLVNSTIFAQEIKGNGCNVIRFPVPFFKSVGAYALKWTESKFQFGGGTATDYVFELGDDTLTRGVIGCSFSDNEVEGNGCGFLKAHQISGLSMVGNYVEANAGQFLHITYGSNLGVGLLNNSILSTAANIADTTYYEVYWGGAGTNKAFAAGNFTTGRLHDDTGLLAGEFLHHDAALVALTKTTTAFTAARPSGVVKAQRGITAYAGGGQANAVQITAPHAYVATVASTDDSVKLPPAVPQDGFALTVRVFNLGANTLKVWGDGTDSILGSGSSINVASGAIQTFTCFNTGYWVYG